MARRRTRLTNVGAILTELGCVYRDARGGRMAWTDAAAAARVLREMRMMLEASDLEARLDHIERQLATAGQQPNCLNGGRADARY